MRLTEQEYQEILSRRGKPQQQSLPQQKALRPKFGNEQVEYGGRLYASKKEAGRAAELDLLVKAGQVLKWEAQVPLRIEYQGVKICTYWADFKVQWSDGRIEIEDVKSVATRTAVYRLKKKLVRAFHGIEITEII